MLATDDRTARIPVKVVQPKVTRDELAKKYPTLLVVNRGAFQLSLYKNLKLQRTYPIAVGQVGLETPAGLYNIQNKAVNAAWSVPNSDWAGSLAGTVVPGGAPNNPLKARWMGIFDGAGIHGTDDVGSLGTAASHGCVRMAVPDVIELYDQVEVQTPVYISLRSGGSWTSQIPMASIGTSSHPCSSREAWRPTCRTVSWPMNTPRNRLRRTAYHMVDASLGPWIGCHGAVGPSSASNSPASASCEWVATRPS